MELQFVFDNPRKKRVVKQKKSGKIKTKVTTKTRPMDKASEKRKERPVKKAHRKVSRKKKNPVVVMTKKVGKKKIKKFVHYYTDKDIKKAKDGEAKLLKHLGSLKTKKAKKRTGKKIARMIKLSKKIAASKGKDLKKISKLGMQGFKRSKVLSDKAFEKLGSKKEKPVAKKRKSKKKKAAKKVVRRRKHKAVKKHAAPKRAKKSRKHKKARKHAKRAKRSVRKARRAKRRHSPRIRFPKKVGAHRVTHIKRKKKHYKIVAVRKNPGILGKVKSMFSVDGLKKSLMSPMAKEAYYLAGAGFSYGALTQAITKGIGNLPYVGNYYNRGLAVVNNFKIIGPAVVAVTPGIILTALAKVIASKSKSGVAGKKSVAENVADAFLATTVVSLGAALGQQMAGLLPGFSGVDFTPMGALPGLNRSSLSGVDFTPMGELPGLQSHQLSGVDFTPMGALPSVQRGSLSGKADFGAFSADFGSAADFGRGVVSDMDQTGDDSQDDESGEYSPEGDSLS